MKQKTASKTNTTSLIKKRAELAAQGINLRELCAENQINYQSARDLLRGKAKGRRGDAHHAAVFLGLKPTPKKLAV